MATIVRQIQVRLPWLRASQGDKASTVAKAVLSHQKVRKAIEQGVCPICERTFEQCVYFQNILED